MYCNFCSGIISHDFGSDLNGGYQNLAITQERGGLI